VCGTLSERLKWKIEHVDKYHVEMNHVDKNHVEMPEKV